MSITQVSGGLVSVEDSKKHTDDEFGRRKVRVELTFGVADGDSYDAIFDATSQAASNRVHALLHGTAIAAVQTDTQVPSEATPEAEKATRTRRTKAQIEADKRAAENPAAMTPEPETAEDPAAIGTTDAQGGTTDFDPLAPIEPEPAADDPAAMTGGEDVTAGVTVISDADLNDAVMKKNGELNDPLAIRKLIGSYNPDPTKQFMLAQIPQADRAGFLTKLGALKAAA